MKSIFVVNPKTGKGKGLDKLKAQIASVSEELGIEEGFYLTKAVGDAEEFAKLTVSEAENFDAEKVYFEMEPLAVNFVVPKILEDK